MARADLLYSNDTRARHAASWYAASASPGPVSYTHLTLPTICSV